MVTQFPDVSHPKSNPAMFTPANLTLLDVVGEGALLVLAVLVASLVVTVVRVVFPEDVVGTEDVAVAVDVTLSVVVPVD